MERSEVGLGMGVGAADGGGGNSKGSDGFVDRSKVKILLCDNDSKSSVEVFELLCKCSYQVTSVRSPRQVIDALNAEGPDIDIILSEVDLPMAKGMKMLKYIMRDKELRRIPVIMMSPQDEVSIVVKCLKLGAADYLVKPLRTNELLNLWTHMWRRRRMLGLAEKNIFIYDFDLVVSDPSDANTNSTTLFSDDTDEKSRKSANPEMCISTHQGDQTNAATAAAPVETPFMDLSENWLDVPEYSDLQAGQISSWPKKSELKIGESSAFFTYVKSNTFKSNTQGPVPENAPQHSSIVKEHIWAGQMGTDSQGHANREAQDGLSQGDDHPSNNSIPDSFSVERSCTPPLTQKFSQGNSNTDGVSKTHMHPTNESQHDVQGFHPHAAYSYYFSGVMNQVMMQSSAQIYQKNLQELQHNAHTSMLSQFSHMAQCPPHIPGMPSFPYYPVSICLQPGQMPATHPWQSCGTCTEEKLSKVDRREVALMKFRQKRKDRCFDKKIRYVNRKRLAERRPRVRGQFVRKTNGVNVDLNGHPASADDEDYEEDEEDPAARDSSPEDDTSISQR